MELVTVRASLMGLSEERAEKAAVAPILEQIAIWQRTLTRLDAKITRAATRGKIPEDALAELTALRNQIEAETRLWRDTVCLPSQTQGRVWDVERSVRVLLKSIKELVRRVSASP